MRIIKFKGLLASEPYTRVYGDLNVISNNIYTIDGHQVNPRSICQYSGYDDKDDVEIYENDYVEYHGEKGVVCYGSHIDDGSIHLGFYIYWFGDTEDKFREDFMFWINENKLKVIGHIW